MSEADAFDARSEPAVPALDATRFEMMEAIGSGGMGTVYRALQRSVGRYVAVKMLSPEHAANSTGLARFVREANAIARLAHPNIVQLIDFGRDRDGRMLLVMELLEGESLRALLRREKTLDVERAVWVTVQCLNALRTAHAAGVIHRDLKPENIFIHQTGGEDHVKVLDFGVAKLTQSDVGEHTTQGSLVGTLRYMAPEQIAGDPPDPRIDVYAMGILLYEMLSGSVPYATKDRYVLLRQIIAEPPRELHDAAPDLPLTLCAVVMHALVKNPGDRYASAEEFRRALLPFVPSEAERSQLLSEPGGRAPAVPLSVESTPPVSGRFSIAHPAPAPPQLPTEHLVVDLRPAPRSRWRLVGAFAAVCALGLLGAGAGILYSMMTASTPQRAPVAPPIVIPPTPVIAARSPLPAAQPTPRPVVPEPTPVVPSVRTVVITTSPPGARVIDLDGTVLCLSTPCAVPVAHGHVRSVQVTLGAASVSVALDGSQSTVQLDLASVSPPPVERTHSPHPRRHVDDGLPMFLPGGGH